VFVSSEGQATILHADLDAFYASVAQRDDPALRGRPVVVGGGVVLAASYEARARGVRSAMGGRRARELCPGLTVVRPKWSAYVKASRQVFELFAESAPVVEGLSIDEAFLDVSGLERIKGTPEQIAERLRRDVRRRVGLPLTVGVARTKSLAKVASAVAKPDGLLVVEPGRELDFLHPLPVESLWGVGPATSARLHRLGISRVRDVAEMSEAALIALLGNALGRKLHALAWARDPRRVRRTAGRRSVGSQSALGNRRRSPAELDAVVVGLVDRVSRRMRAGGRAGRTVCLRIRFGDYTRASRSTTLPKATAATKTILGAARGLLRAAMPVLERRGVTLLGIAVTNLQGRGEGVQLELDGAGAAVDMALDDLRNRYGARSVTRAVLLGHRAAQPWLFPGEEPLE
jgi:DNA polymerase-4